MQLFCLNKAIPDMLVSNLATALPLFFEHNNYEHRHTLIHSDIPTYVRACITGQRLLPSTDLSMGAGQMMDTLLKAPR